MSAPKGNKHAKGNKGGRPAKLNQKNAKDVAEAMVEFFVTRYDEFKNEVRAWKGDKRRHPEPFVDVPFLYDFGREVGMSYLTMYKYQRDCEDLEFRKAYTLAQEIQKKYISLASMNGLSHPSFSIFAATNLTDWRQKQQVTGKDDGPIAFEDLTEMSDEQLARLAGIGSGG